MGKKDEKEKKQLERGAKDDWEALKMILEDSPALKQRVLHKMREMKGRSRVEGKIVIDEKKTSKDSKAK